MKKIYTVAKYAKSIMLAAVMTASALTTVNAQEADNTTYAPAEANSWWRGEEVTGEEQQVYVYNVGAGIFVTTDDTPSEKNIDNAALYKEASELTSNEKISTSLLNQLKEILTSTATANYGTYTTNKTTLQNIINTIKTYLNSTPTGIDNINANSSAKTEAIFSVNGVRNAQLNKGLNIVKMSDGSIKKIMVK